MRTFNIINTSADTPARKDIKDRFQKYDLTSREMDRILKDINEGHTDLIDDLLTSAEGIILQVMLYMPDSRFSIDQRMSHAKASLKSLAKLDLDLTSRRPFERFCAFNVRQSLIALEDSKVNK